MDDIIITPVTTQSSVKRKATVKDGPRKRLKIEKDVMDYCWSVDEELALYDRIQECVGSSCTEPLNICLPRIDWERVAFGWRSALECRNMFYEIYKKIGRNKSLACLVEDIKKHEAKQNEKFYCSSYCSANKHTAPYEDLWRLATEKWKYFSSNNKEMYRYRHKRLSVKKHSYVISSTPLKPRDPFLVYCDTLVERLSSIDEDQKNRLRKDFDDMMFDFDDMKFEKKLYYIEVSLKEYGKYLQDRKLYRQSHPNWRKKKTSLHYKFMFEEYLDYLGVPRYDDPKDIFFDEMRKRGEFCHTSDSDQYKAEKKVDDSKFKKQRLLYDVKYRNWKDRLPKDVVLFVKEYFENESGVVPRYKLQRVEEPVTELTARTNGIESVCDDLLGDHQENITSELQPPEKPPASAFEIFYLKFEQSCHGKVKTEEMGKMCSLAWSIMPKAFKLKYKERHKENVELYKKRLLQYIQCVGGSEEYRLGLLEEADAHFAMDFKKKFLRSQLPNNEVQDQECYALIRTKRHKDLNNSKRSVKVVSEEKGRHGNFNLIQKEESHSRDSKRKLPIKKKGIIKEAKKKKANDRGP